jgi:HEAT repeat protein
MTLHYLIVSIVVLSALCIAPLIALAALRVSKAVQSHGLERSVRKNASLLSSLAAGNGAASEDTLFRLARLSDAKLVEQLIDRSAAAANKPIGDFREVYDGALITQRYISILEKSKSWKKRAFAAEKLGQIGSPTALPTLLSIVRDVKNEDDDVRGAALRALGRIRDARAVPFLIEALGYPDTWLPPRIGEILVSIGEPAIPELQAELRENHSEHVRMWAAEILGWLQAASAAPALIDALSDINPEVRARSAAALGRIKDDRSVHRLLELLISDPAPFVRVKVSQALGAIGHPAVIDYLITTLKDPEWWVRVRAVEALEKMGQSAVAGLLPALEDEDAEVRRRAAMALERIGYVEQILDDYAQPAFKQDLRRILLLVAEAGVIESLSQKLATGEGTIRKRIVRLFGDAGVKEASGPLLELLSETTEWSLKARIIESLGKIGARDAVPRLVEHLRHREDWVRKSTVEALGRLEAQDAADDVAGLLDDPSPIARESALEALLRLGVSKHRDKIEGLLLDPTPRVRRTAIKVLRELGLPLNENAASVLLADTSEEVKAEAIRYFAKAGDARRALDIARLLPRAAPPLRAEIVAYFRAVRSAVSFEELCSAIRIDGLAPEALAALIDIVTIIGGDESHRFVAGFIQSAEPSLRERAFASLAQFGIEKQRKTFEKGLLDPASQVRISVLAGIAADPHCGLLEHARSLSNDPDVDVRTALALSLGASGADELRRDAAGMLEDPSLMVNAGALISLAAFDDPSLLEIIRARWSMTDLRAAINATKKDDRFRPMLEIISRNAARSNNLEVAFILAENEREFMQDLIRKIRESHDPAARVKAMEILTMLPAGEFLTSILGIMKRDPIAELRVHAMEIVSASAREDEAISAVSSMLVDPSPAVRTKAAEILGRHSTPQALEALLHVLDTSDRKFREAVTTSLSALLADNPDRFSELLRSIPESKTRKIGMAWLMGKTRKQGSMAFLVKLSEDTDPDVRASAVGALAKFKRKQLLSHFDKLLYDPSERVRAASVNAIAAIGGAAAFALCGKALEDIDEFVRQRAAIGLAKMDPAQTILLIREKGTGAGDLESYARGILFATGAAGGAAAGDSSAQAVRNDPLARTVVAELCPEDEMRTAFRTSSDRKKRLHAFRMLAMAGVESDGELVALALKDPSTEIREEALQVSG